MVMALSVEESGRLLMRQTDGADERVWDAA